MGFRVSIGKRKGFDLGLQGRMKKEGFMVFWWAPCICGTHVVRGVLHEMVS